MSAEMLARAPLIAVPDGTCRSCGLVGYHPTPSHCIRALHKLTIMAFRDILAEAERHKSTGRPKGSRPKGSGRGTKIATVAESDSVAAHLAAVDALFPNGVSS